MISALWRALLIKTMTKMEISELEELRDFSELDFLYKIIDIAEGKKKRLEQFMKGNKAAGTDVRQSMQDIRFLAELIRESIQINKGIKKVRVGNYKGSSIELNKIEKAIVDKKINLEKEERYIVRIENLRKEKRDRRN